MQSFIRTSFCLLFIAANVCVCVMCVCLQQYSICMCTGVLALVGIIVSNNYYCSNSSDTADVEQCWICDCVSSQ